jgi:hypothetical protein
MKQLEEQYAASIPTAPALRIAAWAESSKLEHLTSAFMMGFELELYSYHEYAMIFL